MLESNSRIENYSGLKFYEQDILFDNYEYSGDIKVMMNIDYISPGIGVALINHEGATIESKREVYLFKIGYKSVSVLYRLDDIQQELLHLSVNIAPIHENIMVNFSKIGKRIAISVDGYGTVLDYVLQARIEQFNLGFYSNAGNTINSMSIASSIPDQWMVNMKNTNGGHIKFISNGFELNECSGQAEIEQDNVQLTAGSYFLKYTTYILGDIKPYVIKSGDNRLYDSEKNLLDSNMKFILENDAKVNIKFKGKTGGVKEIYLTNNYKDHYVPTTHDGITINGSYINVELKDVDEVLWSGTIDDVPDEEPDSIYAVVADDITNLKTTDISVVVKSKFNYRFIVETSTFEVSQNNKLLSSKKLNNVSDKITIFKNVNAIIDQFDLKQSNGKVINLIVEDTSKKYVPSTIASPIIVVDSQDTPFHLSSSYRVTSENGYDEYIFTNMEREIFNPDEEIRTESLFIQKPGSIIVYGVLKEADINENNIFRIPSKALDSIDLYCDEYEILYENDLQHIDYASGIIILSEQDKYQKIVVDYLKNDSYCINYLPDIDMYEVDISTDRSDAVMKYDHKTDDNNVEYSSSYVMEMLPQSDHYIVLRGKDFV